jgi:hypothetical protein
MIHKCLFPDIEAMAEYLAEESSSKERRRVPSPQYKYLKKEFALDLVSKGIIRIGTLKEFSTYCEMAVDFTPNSGGTLQAMAHVLYNYTKH